MFACEVWIYCATVAQIWYTLFALEGPRQSFARVGVESISVGFLSTTVFLQLTADPGELS